MFKVVRVVATIIFLASIVLVFIGAFVIGSDVSGVHFVFCRLLELSHSIIDSVHSCVSLLCLLVSLTHSSPSQNTMPTVFVIIEYLAYTWYTLSYIPYARTAVLKVFGM